MKRVVGTRIKGELGARIDKEAADKKCSLAAITYKKSLPVMINLELQIFIW